jgi:hypothetical protein
MKRLSGLLIVLAACGGSDDRVDDFVGTWTYQAGGTSNIDCDNNALDMMEVLSGSFQLAAGTSSDLIQVPDANDACQPVRLDVSGGTANAQTGQSCMATVQTVTVTTTVNQYTLTLDSAGTTITLQGRASAVFSGAATATCTATLAGSATKTGARTAGEPSATWLDPLVRRAVAR